MGLLGDVTQQDYFQNGEYGNYQFTSLEDIINQFMVVYVGEGKIIPKINRVDVQFHAMRALQELSFDTLKSVKAEEITIPPSLEMILPQDYVNYTKISWVDSSGIKHRIYPTLCKTSNPGVPPTIDTISAFGDVLSRGKHIVLNGQYDNITYGMEVTVRADSKRTALSSNTVIVEQVITSDGVTTVYLDDIFTNDANNVLFEFSLPAGETNITDIVIPVYASFAHQLYADYPNDTDLIMPAVGLTMDNFDKLEVGMLIVSREFAPSTFITGLFPSDGTNPDIVHLSNKATTGLSGTPGVSGVAPLNTTTASFIPLSSPAFANGGSRTETIHFKYRDGVTDWYQQNKSTTASNYKSATPSENNINDYQDYQNHNYWPNEGRRYGLDPQHAQVNGSFYIDQNSGKIHFSSNLAGKTLVLDYISDSLGTDAEMQVHKFAEEAMYKSISHAILSTSSYGQALVRRLTKEKFAAVRKAKLRLSNLKLEELTQVLRGKSKQIKH